MRAEQSAGATLMSKSNRTAGCNFLRAAVVVAVLSAAAIAGTGPARAAGACALVPNERAPSEKILRRCTSPPNFHSNPLSFTTTAGIECASAITLESSPRMAIMCEERTWRV